MVVRRDTDSPPKYDLVSSPQYCLRASLKPIFLLAVRHGPSLTFAPFLLCQVFSPPFFLSSKENRFYFSPPLARLTVSLYMGVPTNLSGFWKFPLFFPHSPPSCNSRSPILPSIIGIPSGRYNSSCFLTSRPPGRYAALPTPFGSFPVNGLNSVSQAFSCSQFFILAPYFSYPHSLVERMEAWNGDFSPKFPDPSFP